MNSNSIILGLRKAPYREGGYTLETVEVEYNADGSVKNYSNTGFEFLSQDFIDERNDVEWAENERDLWEQAVQGGYTSDSLEDWYEDLVDTCYGLFPYDDDSYRDDVEKLWDELSKKKKKEIEEFVGEKGEVNDEDNRGDWVTFNCVHMTHLGDPDEQDDWVLVFNKNLLKKIVEHDAPYHEPKFCPCCGKQVGKHEPMYWSHSSEFGGNPLCEACDKELDERDRDAQRLEEKKRHQELKEKQSSIIIDYFRHRATLHRQDPDYIEDIVSECLEDISEDTLKLLADDLESIYANETV